MHRFRLALAALALTSLNAHAGLTNYAPWDAHYPGIAGVQFNVQSSTMATRDMQGTIAMGAHAYKNGVLLPNDGVSVYQGASGLYEANRANWSFDYAWDLTNCNGCSVQLWVDVDKSAGVDMRQLLLADPDATTYFESWNMEMTFIEPFLGGYNFDPFSPSSTVFSLRLMNAAGAMLTNADITVNVPEPGSMALLGLGIAGMGVAARRRRTRA